MKKLTLSLFLLIISFYSHAAYWIDTGGKIESMYLYAHSNIILVNLSNNGTDVAECSNKNTFAISASMDPEARSRMYAMLLARQTADKPVVVSYSNINGCEPYGSNANAYRKIVRLR